MTNRLMKSRRLALALRLFALALSCACARDASPSDFVAPAARTAAAPAQTAAAARTLAGRVVGVSDGDTITVLGAGNRQTRVRLLGIDAPESRQAFGAASKRSLSDLVFDREVVVEYEKTDGYGRTLGKVLAGGADVNLEQVRAGLAWHYKYYQDDQSPADRRLYGEAEAEARAARRGLWADPDPGPPWDFRRGKRPAAGEEGEAGGAADGETPASSRGAAAGRPAVEAEPVGEEVYVTRTGAKYHRPGCQYLRRSRIPISLKEARQSYGPCSVCRPPR